MEELFKKLLDGIDLSDPDAPMQLFWRMMGLVDWWALFWATVACTVIGGLIGRYKGETTKGLVLGATLGPIGWVVSLMSKSKQSACPACRRGNPLSAKFCSHCGARVNAVAPSAQA